MLFRKSKIVKKINCQFKSKFNIRKSLSYLSEIVDTFNKTSTLICLLNIITTL